MRSRASRSLAAEVRQQLRNAQSTPGFGDGAGLPAASHDGLSTGFSTATGDPFKYFRRLHVGATAWNVFGQLGFNPYYQTYSTPAIAITSVPDFGTTGLMHGTVAGVDFSQYRVAAFIYVPGLGWYTKPSVRGADGGDRCRRDLAGGCQHGRRGQSRSTGDDSRRVAGARRVRPRRSVGRQSARPRGTRRVSSRHERALRADPPVCQPDLGGERRAQPAGPGSNYFSALPTDIWSDPAGLHLTLHDHDGSWWSTETTLLGEELGYGTYWYQTNSRTDNLDVNVTFGGGFTFDDYGDEASPDGSGSREIDVGEDSRWGVATDPNTQNTKQPYDFVAANRHRFNLPDLSSDPALTRILIWKPDSLHFITLKGDYSPAHYPPSAVVDEYLYTQDEAAGRYVPKPGRERVHFNLWLNKTVNGAAPSDGQPVEVVIKDFAFAPDPAAPVITGATTAGAVKWHAFHYQIAATNSPTRFGASGLPEGFTVHADTGAISGCRPSRAFLT